MAFDRLGVLRSLYGCGSEYFSIFFKTLHPMLYLSHADRLLLPSIKTYRRTAFHLFMFLVT